MICPPKVGLNNQLIKVQIFYDQIQHSFQTTSHRVLSFKMIKIIHLLVNIFNLPVEHCDIG